jgi:hypothetical protein
MGRVDASADQGKTWGPTFQDPDMNHYTAFAFGFSPG